MEKTIKFLDGEYFGPVNANDDPHGFGRYETSKGWIYYVEWVNGCAHGDGVLESPDGDSFYCTWVNGVIEGRVELRCANGEVWEQFYKQNKLLSEKRIK